VHPNQEIVAIKNQKMDGQIDASKNSEVNGQQVATSQKLIQQTEVKNSEVNGQKVVTNPGVNGQKVVTNPGVNGQKVVRSQKLIQQNIGNQKPVQQDVANQKLIQQNVGNQKPVQQTVTNQKPVQKDVANQNRKTAEQSVVIQKSIQKLAQQPITRQIQHPIQELPQHIVASQQPISTHQNAAKRKFANEEDQLLKNARTHPIVQNSLDEFLEIERQIFGGEIANFNQINSNSFSNNQQIDEIERLTKELADAKLANQQQDAENFKLAPKMQQNREKSNFYELIKPLDEIFNEPPFSFVNFAALNEEERGWRSGKNLLPIEELPPPTNFHRIEEKWKVKVDFWGVFV
jgi:KRAB domain-containing zinc finger protein/PAX-interacting protein 1